MVKISPVLCYRLQTTFYIVCRYVCPILTKIMYLVFIALRLSLLAISHLFILSRSSFINLSIYFRLLPEADISVSSA